MHLSSSSGINELMEFSRTGFVQLFSAALQDMRHRQAPDGTASITLLLRNSATTSRSDPTDLEYPTRRSPSWMFLAGVASLSAAGTAIVAAYVVLGPSRTSTGTYELASGPPPVPTTAIMLPGSMPPTDIITQKLTNAPIQPDLRSLPIVTVRTSANIRNRPSISATVIRIAALARNLACLGEKTAGYK